MSTRTSSPDVKIPPRLVHRFSIEEYERLVKIGFLTPSDRAELIDGWLVDKMPQNPRHAGVVDVASKTIERLLPEAWTTRSQLPVRLPGDNAPEPDLAIVPAPSEQYFERHPTEKDVALVIEVSDSTLDEDRRLKLPQYARAKIPLYWIVNLVDRVVEVYSEPRGGKTPTYKQQTDYGPSAEVPVIVRGQEVGRIPARKLLPPA